jgi:hypothetical protein
MRYLVCLIYGVVEGTGPEKTEPVKNQLKQLVSAASGFPAENMIVHFEQPLRFMDAKEGVFCEIKWPRGEVPKFESENLRESISGLFKSVLGVTKFRVDFET